MIERSMSALALLGSEWVLWLLLVLSVISVSIMIERVLFYGRRKVDTRDVAARLLPMLQKGDVSGAESLLAPDTMEAHVMKQGLANLSSARWATTRHSSGCSARCSASSARSAICR
jgi:biopolymer transport protein ExbB/TolQ